MERISEIKQNIKMIIALIIALIVVLFINSSNQQSGSYLGVVDTKEINVSSAHPVTINKIHVISGQRVRKDQILIDVDRPDLTKEITSLEHSLDVIESELKFNLKINSKLQSVKFDEDDQSGPLSIKIKGIKEQLKLLTEEKKKLKVYANNDGIVGAVNVKAGETVSAFSPIITLHSTTPTLVKGFVHEKIHNHTFEAQKVIVSSIADPTKKISAVVASIGNRIVEFPKRLNKAPDMVSWGREVVVMLPTNNPFLVGEKVVIESTKKKIPLFDRKQLSRDILLSISNKKIKKAVKN